MSRQREVEAVLKERMQKPASRGEFSRKTDVDLELSSCFGVEEKRMEMEVPMYWEQQLGKRWERNFEMEVEGGLQNRTSGVS
jgi:hypothetical protein